MKFFKVEKTKKNGILGLLFVAAVVASFIAGGYVATNNLNPFGNKHYYQLLNANFQECHTLSGVSSCTQEHNVLFNAGAAWVEHVVVKGNVTTGCAIAPGCAMTVIAMSAGATTPVATDSVTGSTNGNCGKPTDNELGSTGNPANGFGAATATVTDGSFTTTGTQATTLVKTFTAAAQQAVAKSCIVNQVAPDSTNRVQLAAAQFTSITLQSGDTIQITWTLTWSWT